MVQLVMVLFDVWYWYEEEFPSYLNIYVYKRGKGEGRSSRVSYQGFGNVTLFVHLLFLLIKLKSKQEKKWYNNSSSRCFNTLYIPTTDYDYDYDLTDITIKGEAKGKQKQEVNTTTRQSTFLVTFFFVYFFILDFTFHRLI